MSGRVVAVIPARYESSRFPGKPLVDIAGKTMIEHVWRQTGAIAGVDEVIVATDDERILETVTRFGGRCCMTSVQCASGTDRVAEAVAACPADIVLNIQGDQVVLDSDAVARMIVELGQGAAMATLAVPADDDEFDDPNCVKVVCDSRGFALYFSRAPIPQARDQAQAPRLKHIGIYGFARATLTRFTGLAPTPLELTESLEQLRALENGIPIRVIVARGRFAEINTPQDYDRVVQSWRA